MYRSGCHTLHDIVELENVQKETIKISRAGSSTRLGCQAVLGLPGHAVICQVSSWPGSKLGMCSLVTGLRMPRLFLVQRELCKHSTVTGLHIPSSLQGRSKVRMNSPAGLWEKIFPRNQAVVPVTLRTTAVEYLGQCLL